MLQTPVPSIEKGGIPSHKGNAAKNASYYIIEETLLIPPALSRWGNTISA